MIKSEICRKISMLGGEKQRTLVYYLIADLLPRRLFLAQYGVGVSVLESRDEVDVRCITPNRSRAVQLADLLASNYVTPVALGDVVYDWLCK